jgi:hypothetical protein
MMLMTSVTMVVRVNVHMIIGLRPVDVPRRTIVTMRMVPAAAKHQVQAVGSDGDGGNDWAHFPCSVTNRELLVTIAGWSMSSLRQSISSAYSPIATLACWAL